MIKHPTLHSHLLHCSVQSERTRVLRQLPSNHTNTTRTIPEQSFFSCILYSDEYIVLYISSFILLLLWMKYIHIPNNQPYYYLSTYYICSVLNSMSPSYITELLRYIAFFHSFYLSVPLFVWLFICLIVGLHFPYLSIFSLLWTVCPCYI